MDTDVLAGDSRGSQASLTGLGSDSAVLLVVSCDRFTACVPAKEMVSSHDPYRAAKD